MLDDGGVDDEFVLRRGHRLAGGGLGDERFQHVIDDGVVPPLGLRVFVDRCPGDSRITGIVTDLSQARRGDGLKRVGEPGQCSCVSRGLFSNMVAWFAFLIGRVCVLIRTTY